MRSGDVCPRSQAATERPAKPGPDAERGNHLAEDVRRAHGDAAGRHRGAVTDLLGRVGEEALQDGGTQARPDEPFGDMRFRAGVHGAVSRDAHFDAQGAGQSAARMDETDAEATIFRPGDTWRKRADRLCSVS